MGHTVVTLWSLVSQHFLPFSYHFHLIHLFWSVSLLSSIVFPSHSFRLTNITHSFWLQIELHRFLWFLLPNISFLLYFSNSYSPSLPAKCTLHRGYHRSSCSCCLSSLPLLLPMQTHISIYTDVKSRVLWQELVVQLQPPPPAPLYKPYPNPNPDPNPDPNLNLNPNPKPSRSQR